MNIIKYWNTFIKNNPSYKDFNYDSWSYGVDADLLAELTLNGVKTATASLFDLYGLENEELPKNGQISIILDSSETKPICIIQTTKVSIVPFRDVDEDHALKEGEGDRSLAYWRAVHKTFFEECIKDTSLDFTEDSLVVLEEFEVIYRQEN